MQAILELIVAVIVWMAVASLNQLGLKVDFPEPPEKADARAATDCPDAVKVAKPTATAA
jgi:hypothetical protein